MTGFGLHNLPYGSFRLGDRTRAGVRVDDTVLDLTAAGPQLVPAHPDLFAAGTLDALLAAGPQVWAEVRTRLQGELGSGGHDSRLLPLDEVEMVLPFAVADYVDFYSSEHHARNLGRILRPGQEELPVNWRHLPVGYHGRAGTVVVSGTPVLRPNGQRREADGTVSYGPSRRLDFEAEVGFLVGVPSEMGRPVPLADFAQHVFGVCLVNDWSARDVQAWEYVPLGPFLGKSFATSVSPWIVPLAALDEARVAPPPRDPTPLPYLDDSQAEPWGLDLRLEVQLNGEVVSRPPFADMYWTPAQQLAHLTVNGATVRTGDLFASGTVSGVEPTTWGSLMELSYGGSQSLTLADGSSRTFLEDGDEVTISATTARGAAVGLGAVAGRVGED